MIKIALVLLFLLLWVLPKTIYRFCRDRLEKSRQRRYIESLLEELSGFQLPPVCREAFAARYPQLDDKQRKEVEQALLQFFRACLQAGQKPLGMPSQVVGDLWLAFSRCNTDYQRFVEHFFPAGLPWSAPVPMSSSMRKNGPLTECWQQACRIEAVNPENPEQLPTLFGLDSKLNIHNGFHYLINILQPKERTISLRTLAGTIAVVPAALLAMQGLAYADTSQRQEPETDFAVVNQTADNVANALEPIIDIGSDLIDMASKVMD